MDPTRASAGALTGVLFGVLFQNFIWTQLEELKMSRQNPMESTSSSISGIGFGCTFDIKKM